LADFVEWLQGSYSFSVLQDDKEALRFLFQLYDSHGILKWDAMQLMAQEIHGDNYCSKMWTSLKDKLEVHCAIPQKCTWPEFKQCIASSGVLLMPVFSLRNQMREQLFGPKLWESALKQRKQSNPKYDKGDIAKLSAEMQGLAAIAKKNKRAGKCSQAPVKHASLHKGSVVVGRSTIAQHYKGKARAKKFETNQDFKVRPRPDLDFGRPMSC